MTTMIRIKYIECLSNNADVATLDATSIEREMLINIDCPIKMILDYIRKVSCLDNSREFDLCDEANCQLKNVFLHESCARGIDILQPDIVYYIVIFERDENNQMINFTPVLTGKAAKRCSDILSKIRKPMRRTSSIKSNLKKHNASKFN